MQVCENCKTTEETEKQYQKCGACRVVFYCSRECQKGNWPIHKHVCRKRYTEEMAQLCKEDGRKADAAAAKVDKFAAMTGGYILSYDIPQQLADVPEAFYTRFTKVFVKEQLLAFVCASMQMTVNRQPETTCVFTANAKREGLHKYEAHFANLKSHREFWWRLFAECHDPVHYLERYVFAPPTVCPLS